VLRRSLEHGILRPVDQRLRAFCGKHFRVVLRAVDIAFPHLARQLVEHLDAVTVGSAMYTL